MSDRHEDSPSPAGADAWHCVGLAEDDPTALAPLIRETREEEAYACAPSLKERRLLLKGSLDIVSKEAAKIRLFA